jgi:hypothetical protein
MAFQLGALKIKSASNSQVVKKDIPRKNSLPQNPILAPAASLPPP